MSYLQSHELNILALRLAYGMGIFPMAEGPDVNDLIHWYQPDPRAVIAVSDFHIPRSLARLIVRKPFRIAWNDDFPAVMQACAERREGSWINQPLIDAYSAWARAGEAF